MAEIRYRSCLLQSMARVLGEAGRFTNQTAEGHRKRQLRLGILVIGLLGLLEGMCVSFLWSMLHPPRWLNYVILYGDAAVVAAVYFWSIRKLDELEGEKAKWQRGADGETTVGKILAGFPDDYYVINDIKTPGEKSNLDHVVVGPTGVYVLDAKNWGGVVQADGKGELWLNGKPLDKPYVRRFIGRLMRVKEKVVHLADGLDPYFKGLFVFTAAQVEAAWGKTGDVYCLRENQLWKHIVENDFGKRLKPAEVKKIAEAFRVLATMDSEFSKRAGEMNEKGLSKEVAHHHGWAQRSHEGAGVENGAPPVRRVA